MAAAPVAVVVEAAAPVVVVAGTHQGVAEAHTPDFHMIHGTVACWHHEIVLLDFQVAWVAEGDVLLLGLWTLSLMFLHQGSPHFRLQGHHKA